ncbi:hypothetical protein LCGC14_1952230 [marine sediment metagenome]|uniref:Uncharacterized protein n=1 Tax=marine sediment metagenome TaxID=412755 RepID=A0A0F9IE62_9ZZZZ
MTQSPQSSDPTDAVDQCPQDDAPPEGFQMPLPSPPPPKLSRKPLILVGVSVVLLIGGVIFCKGKPDSARAKPPRLPVGTMTSDELAKNASSAAAVELARRMAEGTPEQRASASIAVNHWSSPRLVRNMAWAMALDMQTKQAQMVRQMAAQRRRAMAGPDGRLPERHAAEQPPDQE